MALIRCAECGREVSDRAASCPNCAAPVDAATAVPAPKAVSYNDGTFIATPAMLVSLAKKAIGQLNYRLDRADAAAGAVSFTTGTTMGSWSGVSGTISWEEVSPYRYRVTGQGKQNVAGGQMVALNLFNEANGKAQKVVAEMTRLAAGGAEGQAVADNSLALLVAIVIGCLLLIVIIASAGG